MRVMMLTRYSPVRGQRLEPGSLVEVEDEVAVDLIQRGLAAPVKLDPPERAVTAEQR